MKRKTVAAVAAAAAAVLLLYSRRANAGVDIGVSFPDYGDGVIWNPDQWTEPDWTTEPLPAPVPAPVAYGGSLRAFLYAIRASENANPDDYNVFYGGSRFYDLSDHPVATGEKVGIRLSDTMCRNAGFGPGCVSTAAGAYQITLPTWQEFRAYGGETLPDFGPDSQDIAAARILGFIGALDHIEAGDIETAIQIAGQRWASLPGSTARQNPKSMNYVLAKYEQGLSLLG